MQTRNFFLIAIAIASLLFSFSATAEEKSVWYVKTPDFMSPDVPNSTYCKIQPGRGGMRLIAGIACEADNLKTNARQSYVLTDGDRTWVTKENNYLYGNCAGGSGICEADGMYVGDISDIEQEILDHFRVFKFKIPQGHYITTEAHPPRGHRVIVHKYGTGPLAESFPPYRVE